MEKLHVDKREWNTCKFPFSVRSYWYPPILYTVERFFIGNVVHKYEAHGATIVCCCDGAVPFLSSSVLWRSIIPLFGRQSTWGIQSLTTLLTCLHCLRSFIEVPLISKVTITVLFKGYLCDWNSTKYHQRMSGSYKKIIKITHLLLKRSREW